MTTVQKDNLQIEVDRELCIGAASCSIIAPNTFALDSGGKVVILEGDWDDEATIEAAAESCPVRAIVLTKIETALAASPKAEETPVIALFDQEVVMDKLKTVLDPELGINVVDLGLVYGVYQNGTTLSVDMTLTTPGCPLINEFMRSVREALLTLEGVVDVVVNLTFDPPWDPSKMSTEAAEELGFI